MGRNSHAARLELGHRLDDVGGRDGDVLHAGAAVEVQILLDLRLALARGRLVDRELDPPRAVGHDLGHQRRVLGRDRLVGEVDQLGHPEHALVVVDPFLHVPQLDVADHVVDADQQSVGTVVGDAAGLVAGQEGALVAGALDEHMAGLAVGGDRRQADRAVLVGQLVRGLAGRALHGRRRARRRRSRRAR